jgi:uncharacterized protein YqhQ
MIVLQSVTELLERAMEREREIDIYIYTVYIYILMIVIHITCCIFFWYCEYVAELACMYWYVCAFYIPAHTFKVFLLFMYIYIVQNTIDRS